VGSSIGGIVTDEQSSALQGVNRRALAAKSGINHYSLGSGDH
jgi:hypothetical protein